MFIPASIKHVPTPIAINMFCKTNASSPICAYHPATVPLLIRRITAKSTPKKVESEQLRKTVALLNSLLNSRYKSAREGVLVFIGFSLYCILLPDFAPVVILIKVLDIINIASKKSAAVAAVNPKNASALPSAAIPKQYSG